MKSLDVPAILRLLKQALPHQLFKLDVLPVVDSTNSYLLQKNTEHLHICLAEQQTQGRGRLGKTWFSPVGVNLYCSILSPFNQPVTKLTGLSLMVGTVVAQTLEHYGVPDIGLKWPNDIYVQKNKKIAGILIETTCDHNNLNKVVIGIGVNVALSTVLDQQASLIEQPWTDVASNVTFLPDRTELAILLLKNLLAQLPLFEQGGFGAFQSLWLSKDVLLNQPVTLTVNGKTVTGIARGVDSNGCFILETATGFNYLSSANIQRQPT